MPQLKCIGGAADGRMAYVHDGYSANDQVNVSAKIELNIADFDPQKAFDKVSKSIPCYPYKICVLQYKDVSGFEQKLYYLIPTKWHEWEAILHLFRSHVPYG